jgi:hypothetical protein
VVLKYEQKHKNTFWITPDVKKLIF